MGNVVKCNSKKYKPNQEAQQEQPTEEAKQVASENYWLTYYQTQMDTYLDEKVKDKEIKPKPHTPKQNSKFKHEPVTSNKILDPAPGDKKIGLAEQGKKMLHPGLLPPIEKVSNVTGQKKEEIKPEIPMKIVSFGTEDQMKPKPKFPPVLPSLPMHKPQPKGEIKPQKPLKIESFGTEEKILHKKKFSFVEEVFGTPKAKFPKAGEDIIIKCGLEEMVKLFFKDYVIVWHDPNVDSEENKDHKAQLERFCEVQTFIQWEKASKYVKEAKAICHVLTSGTNGEPLVKEISLSQNISNIYIFCRDKDYHSTWANNYSKVSCIETQIEKVLSQIEQNLLKWYKEASSLRTNLPAFAPIFNNWDKSKINNLHRYLKVLPNFKNRSQAKNDLITLSKTIYLDEVNTDIIKKFEKNYKEYNKKEILKWYTHESFLYKVTNNCLRIASSDSIQYCRLLLKDLEQAIKEQYQEESKNFSGLLYRGAYLSQEEWSSLKANLGQEVEMHGFLSVSKDKNVALNFVQGDANQKVFITIVVPKGPNEEEQGFAEVEEFSRYPDEKEILFNVRSRFTVLEADDSLTQGLPYRHLVLLYGAQGFRKLVTETNPVQEISIPSNISCSICQSSLKRFLFKPINPDLLMEDMYLCFECLPSFLHGNKVPFLCVPQSSETYKTKIKGIMMSYSMDMELPFSGYECCQCHARKQQMYFKCTECSESKRVWCNSCFESLSGCMKEGHAIVLESNPYQFWYEKMSENELNYLKFQSKIVVNDDVFQQAEMFYRCHQYQKSLEYYNIFVQQNKEKGDKSLLATCYHKIGGVYESQGDYKKALEYLSKALDIRKLISGENHADVATSYNSIGSVYNSQGEYIKAAEHHVKALKIRKIIGGKHHHDLANCLNNVALVSYNMGKYPDALKFHSKALAKRKRVYGENHPEIAGSYNNIGLVFTCQGEYKKALEHHSKALEIQKLVYGNHHPDVAASYNNIGNINLSQGEYSKGLENYLKALEIFKSVYKENHLSVAGSYNNLGLVEMNLKNYEKALEYFLKALEIRLETLHKDHPDFAICYSNIGGVYYRQGDWKKALDYSWKAREIRKMVYGEEHEYTISTDKQIDNIVNNREINKNEYFGMQIL